MGENTVDTEETSSRKLGRGGVIAMVVVALLIIGVGTAFGVNAYRDAQATSEAEALVESVMVEQELTDAGLAEYADRMGEAQEALEQLLPLNEMVQARTDVLEAESLTTFGESVATLETGIAEAVEPVAKLAQRFTGDAWAKALIEEYRGGNAELREKITHEAQQAVDALRGA